MEMARLATPRSLEDRMVEKRRATSEDNDETVSRDLEVAAGALGGGGTEWAGLQMKCLRRLSFICALRINKILKGDKISRAK